MEGIIYDKYFVFTWRVEEILKDTKMSDKEKLKQIQVWYELIKNMEDME
jgi:hypothetical protein